MQAMNIFLIEGKKQSPVTIEERVCKSTSQWTIRALRLDGRNDGLMEISMCESI